MRQFWLLGVVFTLVVAPNATAQTTAPATSAAGGAATAANDAAAIDAAIRAAKKRGLVVTYDKFEDATTVWTDLWQTGLGLNLRGGQLAAGALYRVRGKDLRQGADSVLLVFAWRGPDWQFLENQQLILLLDDSARVAVGPLAHQARVGLGRANPAQELLQTAVPVATFRQIAAAGKVEGKLGERTFTLKGEHRQLFRALAATIPVAPHAGE